MSNGTVSRPKRRVVVELDPILGDEVERAAARRSTPYRKMTISDIIREAVARFLLPSEAIESDQSDTHTSRPNGAAEKVEDSK